VLELGYYDGATSGIAQCYQCSTAFRFDIIAWDSAQDRRIFAFSPINLHDFDSIISLYSQNPCFPKWPQISPDLERLSAQIDEYLARAESPEYIVASDGLFETVFAAKRLTDPARDLLPTVFDDYPASDCFDYWKEYIGMPDYKHRWEQQPIFNQNEDS
jgi:hypothetical protein